MATFLEKIMEWALDKEDALAKDCHLDLKDIDNQIEAVENKRKKLKEQFEKEDAEFGHVLDKLHFIRADALKCQESKKA